MDFKCPISKLEKAAESAEWNLMLNVYNDEFKERCRAEALACRIAVQVLKQHESPRVEVMDGGATRTVPGKLEGL